MNTVIRQATEADFPSVLSLVRELAIYQQMPERVLNTVEQMKAEKEYFRCLVAENEDKEIIGIASYFFAYYTWVGKSIYLDDLVVKQSCRGQGVGSLLLDSIIKIAKQENCKRVRWLVSEWNHPSIAFYTKRGVEIDRESYVCDLDAAAIQKW
ncbi:MAG TPA: GNAT family N-acetyltransferase [Chitinophagaceae bacterium]|nr:GNAT family N-acetyltransferase [Chitinophagaceae bacterium]